ncbi:hypothetical protein FGB62_74g11 [Gracilaria domingensis]|nr:hypothetical protein FGB62_74g11 [Gracilaria domingensis]
MRCGKSKLSLACRRPKFSIRNDAEYGVLVLSDVHLEQKLGEALLVHDVDQRLDEQGVDVSDSLLGAKQGHAVALNELLAVDADDVIQESAAEALADRPDHGLGEGRGARAHCLGDCRLGLRRQGGRDGESGG